MNMDLVRDIDWSSIGVGVGMTAFAHPFTYAKVLVQLGYEPMAPILRRNMFFRKQLQYPGIFAYIKHIKQVDGYVGLYRGLMPRICANVSTSITYSVMGKLIKSKESEPLNYNDLSKVCKYTSDEMIARCAAVVITQPFHVIALRTMAEFVGHDGIYTNMWTSTIEIYNEEGVLGFFAGLVPRVAAELITIWLTNLLAHALNKYVLTEGSELKDLRQYAPMVMGYIAQTAAYPLCVTSTVMAVNGSRLAAAHPPNMCHYSGWFSCFKDLYKTGNASRGSSMLFRKAAVQLYSATSVAPIPYPPGFSKIN